MQAEPKPEHAWLERMVGAWTAEVQCVMGPDQPPKTSELVETVRSLGGLWVVAEGSAEGSTETLRAGDFLHLQPGTPYSLHALRDASLLVTFCLVAA